MELGNQIKGELMFKLVLCNSFVKVVISFVISCWELAIGSRVGLLLQCLCMLKSCSGVAVLVKK
jgi:hypothetical protein